MLYYWLLPVLVLALLAVWMFWSGSRRKIDAGTPREKEDPEAIKRGEYLND